MDKQTGFNMSLSEVAQLLGVECKYPDVQLSGVSTDTRTVKPGELFIALCGENFDGNDFAATAMQRGASACLLSKSIEGIPSVVVDDTRRALGKLAAAWRSRFNIPLIAVTGSNGKTTVKEMIASICSESMNVLATRGNLNNDIGVPLTLFGLNQNHQAAVIEMGANHHGEIAWLVEIAKPDVALVTNAGEAHLEGFGSLEGVATAKGEIYSTLNERGCAIINRDDQFYDKWKSMNTTARVISFGMSEKADVTAVWELSEKGSRLNVSAGNQKVEINLLLLGKHNIMNALAAIAVGISLDVQLEQIKSGLEKMLPVSGRLQLKQGKSNSWIIDDTYNANPSSLRVALEVLSMFPGRHFLALGDMGELGDNSEELHRQAGKDAFLSHVDQLYAVGHLASYAADEFGSNGKSFQEQEKLVSAINAELSQDVTVLVKGSRRMHMENVVDSLTVTCEGKY